MIKSTSAGISLPPLSAPATSKSGPVAESAGSFSDALAAAVTSVTEQGVAAETEAKKLASGAGNVHETALALEKADVSMRMLLKARNKVIEAYQELSRMPV